MRTTTRIGQKTKHQKATNRVGKKKVGFFRRVGNKLEHIGDGMFNLGNNVGGLAAATGVLGGAMATGVGEAAILGAGLGELGALVSESLLAGSGYVGSVAGTTSGVGFATRELGESLQ